MTTISKASQLGVDKKTTFFQSRRSKKKNKKVKMAL
jgi:hypothetical protein